MLSRSREIGLLARTVTLDDRRAFGEVVQAYSDSLRGFLLSLTQGDVALADDLSQDCFIKAYLSLHSLRGLTRFKTWLFRIAYNEFISHKRRQHTHELLSDKAGASADDIADDTGDDPPITADNLADAIAELSDAQRAVVRLYYFEDFSVARIAGITGMTQTNVKSHLHRARQKLAVLLEKYRY